MNEAILVLNAGSSSIKFSLFEGHVRPARKELVCDGEFNGIGHRVHLIAKDNSGTSLGDQYLKQATAHQEAFATFLSWLQFQFRAPSQPNRFVLFVRHSYPAAIPAHLISFLLEQPTILLPIMVRGGGMRGKDEMTRIEAFGSPSSTEMPRGAKRHRKNRGMPPPATFDIDTLPGSSRVQTQLSQYATRAAR